MLGLSTGQAGNTTATPMPSIETIDTMPIEAIKAGFFGFVDAIVTTYGDQEQTDGQQMAQQPGEARAQGKEAAAC